MCTHPLTNVHWETNCETWCNCSSSKNLISKPLKKTHQLRPTLANIHFQSYHNTSRHSEGGKSSFGAAATAERPGRSARSGRGVWPRWPMGPSRLTPLVAAMVARLLSMWPMGTKGGAEVMLVPSPKPQEEHVYRKDANNESLFWSKNSWFFLPYKQKHRGIKETGAASNCPKKAVQRM